ncbi:MAG TPA: preprotein translocase subunit SecE [Verrucomicrobiae bacterium]|jgi:preprotein translocase subunit SecE|nr:preprotein translocase subunit SecE [Verrucomicrobiae bacterium]
MNPTTIILIVVIGVAFVIVWRNGQLAKLANFVRETREELNKCTWPTWNELKGSTVVVMISIALLGGFTVLCDAVFYAVMHLLTPG